MELGHGESDQDAAKERNNPRSSMMSLPRHLLYHETTWPHLKSRAGGSPALNLQRGLGGLPRLIVNDPFADLTIGLAACAVGLLLVGLGDAQVARDFVFTDGVNNQLFRQTCPLDIEEDGLIGCPVPLLVPLILDGESDAELVPLLIDAADFHGDVADLLRFAFAVQSELDVITLALAAELFDVLMVAGDQRAEFALGHLQVFLGGVKVT